MSTSSGRLFALTMNEEGPALAMSGSLGQGEMGNALVGPAVCFAGMGPLPFERFYAESDLAPQDLLRQLSAQIDVPKWPRWPWDPTKKPLEGRVDGNRFKVRTLLKLFRDGFRPVVVGTVEAREGGSAIRAVLRFHWVVASWMAIWILLTVTFATLATARQIRSGALVGEFWEWWLFALAGYLPAMFFFWMGSSEVRRVLNDVTRR